MLFILLFILFCRILAVITFVQECIKSGTRICSNYTYFSFPYRRYIPGVPKYNKRRMFMFPHASEKRDTLIKKFPIGNPQQLLRSKLYLSQTPDVSGITCFYTFCTLVVIQEYERHYCSIIRTKI